MRGYRPLRNRLRRGLSAADHHPLLLWQKLANFILSSHEMTRAYAPVRRRSFDDSLATPADGRDTAAAAGSQARPEPRSRHPGRRKLRSLRKVKSLCLWWQESGEPLLTVADRVEWREKGRRRAIRHHRPANLAARLPSGTADRTRSPPPGIGSYGSVRTGQRLATLWLKIVLTTLPNDHLLPRVRLRCRPPRDVDPHVLHLLRSYLERGFINRCGGRLDDQDAGRLEHGPRIAHYGGSYVELGNDAS